MQWSGGRFHLYWAGVLYAVVSPQTRPTCRLLLQTQTQTQIVIQMTIQIQTHKSCIVFSDPATNKGDPPLQPGAKAVVCSMLQIQPKERNQTRKIHQMRKIHQTRETKIHPARRNPITVGLSCLKQDAPSIINDTFTGVANFVHKVIDTDYGTVPVSHTTQSIEIRRTESVELQS